ncbi:MAG TPA: TldD/PmbA family protein [Candidatus Izemoplasmatales bacterium]|nr:TldD/PmbA family protein [Bacillota bacterium]HRY77451.1 TldD/PmbA family protein [Candidatus Izemoplasmatales bacterium]
MNFEKLFAQAKTRGMEDVQAFLTRRNELAIQVYEGELENYEISDFSHLVLRGLYNGRLGTFVTEVLDDSVIDLAVESMIANAKIIDSPDQAVIYAGDPAYEKLTGLFSESLEQMDVAEKIAAVKRLDHTIHAKDARVSTGQTMYGETTKTVFLQNTKGLKLEDKANSAYLGGEVIVKDENDQRTGFDLEISNDFADFDIDRLAGKILEEGLGALGAKPIPTRPYEIILRHDALAVLLSTFQGVFSAEAVQRNMSLLKGKLGQKVGSDLVTIVDDPFLPKSSSSRSFDDEGCATRRKDLIKDGVLTTFLHNLSTAAKDGITTTGNGFGGGVSFVNMKFLPGTIPFEALIASVNDGLLVTGLQGSHAGANPVSGDFSLQATGFLIQNGKLGAPVALVTVAGNFLPLLQDVVAVGADVKTGYYGITCPSVKIRSLAVSGL